MKFTRDKSSVFSSEYVSGLYRVRKTDYNRFGTEWSAFFDGQRIAQATHAKHAKAACDDHESKAGNWLPARFQTRSAHGKS